MSVIHQSKPDRPSVGNSVQNTQARPTSRQRCISAANIMGESGGGKTSVSSASI